MKHYLISNMEPSEIIDIIEDAINEGHKISHDPDRKLAEAWLRGWCCDKTTASFEEALVIFLHNHI